MLGDKALLLGADGRGQGGGRAGSGAGLVGRAPEDWQDPLPNLQGPEPFTGRPWAWKCCLGQSRGERHI